MSRVVELQAGLIKDPAYACEFARLEEDLAKLKTLARARPVKLASAPGKRRSADAASGARARNA